MLDNSDIFVNAYLNLLNEAKDSKTNSVKKPSKAVLQNDLEKATKFAALMQELLDSGYVGKQFDEDEFFMNVESWIQKDGRLINQIKKFKDKEIQKTLNTIINKCVDNIKTTDREYIISDIFKKELQPKINSIIASLKRKLKVYD